MTLACEADEILRVFVEMRKVHVWATVCVKETVPEPEATLTDLAGRLAQDELSIDIEEPVEYPVAMFP